MKINFRRTHSQSIANSAQLLTRNAIEFKAVANVASLLDCADFFSFWRKCQRGKFNLLLLLLIVCLAGVWHSEAVAAKWYSDPISGRAENAGSEVQPWPSFQKIVELGLLKRVRPGDTLLLRSGDHGSVQLSGDNKQLITIAAAPRHRPSLSRLVIRQGSRWRVRGLTIGRRPTDATYKGPVVSLGEYGKSSMLVLEDCFVYGAADSGQLDANKWIALNDGIYLGRNGTKLTSINNYVLNARHGIMCAAKDSLVEGCVVENFSGDGLRLMRDGNVARFNVIRNGYCDEAKHGDRNHDDLVQCFQFGKGTGLMRGIVIEQNLLTSHADDKQPLRGRVQGIGIFDGPVSNFLVKGNVIEVDHWHGLTLVDAQRCTIISNVVWSRWQDVSMFRPWIQLGDKKNLTRDNAVKDNFACLFRVDQPGTVATGNKKTTQAIYNRARTALTKRIIEHFGEFHATAHRDRFTGLPRDNR